MTVTGVPHHADGARRSTQCPASYLGTTIQGKKKESCTGNCK